MRASLIITKAVFIFSSLFIAGCATLGDKYQKVEAIPAGTGLVYFYRPSSFVGGGVTFKIRSGDTEITRLYNGGYYPYFSPPGEREFWAQTESKSSVTLDVVPGGVYYVKGTVGVGFVAGRPHLMVVAPEVGEREIAECKLIPEKRK